MTTATKRVTVAKVGENRGRPRIWIEGKYLSALGFAAGTKLAVSFDDGQITIKADDQNGDRTVSQRRCRPIIDINTKDILDAIGTADRIEITAEAGQITITPAEVEVRQAEREAAQDPAAGTVGSIFSGGGMLDEAAAQAGFATTFGVEWEPDYADVWCLNHQGTMFNGCISQVFDRLPHVELLVGGIPCEPFSAKRRKGVEAHDHPLADMSMWAVFAAYRSNPRVIVFEEAPSYLDSPIAAVTMAAIRRMGYTVEAKVVAGTDYGSLTVRKRAVVVAVSGTAQVNWPAQAKTAATLADLLLPADDERCEWFTRESKPWLFDHWETQAEKGNHFHTGQILHEGRTQVPAISKRYFSGQGDQPVVQHPTQPDTYRWLTVTEVKRLMGVPDDYQLPEAKTTAGEILGQSVLVDVFRRIIEAVTAQ